MLQKVQPMTASDPVLVGSYDYRLVALSVVIAILASYAALDLAGRVTSARGTARLAWLSGGATTMGIGIWSMHYVGMLAFRLPIPVQYDWPTVLLSLLAAIFASAIALFVVSRETMGVFAAVLGSMLMGVGIAAMHYIGMAAMRLMAMCHYSSGLVILSVVLAIVISFVALWLTFRLRGDTAGWSLRKTMSALVMGLAIPIMHYTGMAAVKFSPHPSVQWDHTAAITVSALSITGISMVTLVLLALAILTSVADRRYWTERQLLEAFLEHIPDNVFFKDRDSRFVRISRAMSDYFGLGDPAQAVNKTDSDIFSSEHALEALADEQEIIRLGRSIVRKEEKETWPDGRETWVLTTKVPLRDRQGQIIGTMGISHDISERKRVHRELQEYKDHLEELVAERTAELRLANELLAQDIAARKLTEQELARSNAELEQFAYVASHDLQEPLRMIASYTQLLARRYKGKLDADADDFIGFAVDGAARMQQLIRDLLSYSRLTTQAKPLALASSDAACKAAIANLQKSIEDSAAVVSVGPLPTLMADATQLTQLFQNLIGNAIKYRNERRPEIFVTARPDRNQWVFSIQDNGIGIEPQYFERIFQMFQRLHTRDKYAGTGIGLALCRKIAERHGGNIWVESQPGNGSRFLFTILRAEGVDGEFQEH
jgi:two-component system, sensor histidine kinase and response regulator